jgi:hypothetical protein
MDGEAVADAYQAISGEYSVFQFFPNDHYECVLRDVPVADAFACANHMATTVGAKIGTTRRVIITDGGDHTVWEWQYGIGLVFPVMPTQPPHLKVHAPHKFDCAECGMHVIEFSGQTPTRCASCVHVPHWYDHPEVAKILDPEHHRKMP